MPGDSTTPDSEDAALQLKRLSKVFTEAIDPIIIEDPSGIITDVNPQAEALYGWSKSELVGQRFLKLVPPGRCAESEELLTRCLSGEVIRNYETERMARDGRRIPVQITISRLTDDNGAPLGVVSFARDQSGQRATQSALERSEARFRMLAGNVPGVFAYLGPDLRYRFVNAMFEDLLGRPKEEIIGMSPRDVGDTALYQRARPFYDKALAGEEVNYENWVDLPGKDRRWFRVRHVPNVLEGGTIDGFFTLAIEITEEKRREFDLVDREARLRSIMDSAPDAIITINEDGIVESFSAAAVRLLGYERDEVIGNSVAMLMPEPHCSRHDHYLKNYLETGVAKVIGHNREMEARHKDGTLIPVQLSVAEVHPDGHKIFTGFLHDLRARRQQEELLREAQKYETIGQLAGQMAHDFNNVLSVVISNLQALERTTTPPERRRAARHARDAAELGSRLVRRLVALAKQQPLNPTQIPLNELIRSLLAMLRNLMDERIRVEAKFDARIGTVFSDRVQLENALLNLAVNSRDAIDDTGQLLIETRKVEIDEDHARLLSGVEAGTYIQICVSDTGRGMDEATATRAFEPFFTQGKNASGTGLGLTSISSFAEESAGSVSVYSEPGIGTSVSIFLPDIEETSLPRGLTGPPEPVVDGVPALLVGAPNQRRELTAVRLRGLGFSVVETDTARSAIRHIEAAPDTMLVVSDTVLPGRTSGYDLALAIREFAPGIRFLLVTGLPQTIRQEYQEDGIAVLRKPFSRTELAGTISKLLDVEGKETES